MLGYLGYWALFDKPFARSEGDYFFSAAPQREAIAGLSYFTSSQFGAAFLAAPRRCGVSWLMRHVGQMNGLGNCATEVVITDGVQFDCEEVVASLAQGLGVSSAGNKTVSLEAVDEAIEGAGRDGVRVLWLVDRVGTCLIHTARSLLAVHKNLSVVLGSTPPDYRRYAGLFEESTVRIDLDPLSLEESGDYLCSALADVGCERSLFEDGAVVRLHELTGGAIADLSVAAEVSLAVAARYQMESITTAIVEAALELHAQAA